MRDTIRRKKGITLTLGFLLVAATGLVGQILPEGFVITDVSGRLGSNASAFALLPDERILIANQTTGIVELVVDGSRRSTPLLTVTNLRWSGEQGLLGIAVDPEFPDSNYVYLFHTRDDDLNRVSRYTITGDLHDPHSEALTIDAESQQTIIEFADLTQYHNGGTLRFGSDHTLYISHGDDADLAQAQDLTNLYGAILRINRDGSVPQDNPVFEPEPDGRRGEIFVTGLRNPFRFSLDPLTDELFIGDVGPEDVEELNVGKGGENFGWPTYLAQEPYRPEIPLATSDSTFPVFTYRHTSGMRSVIGLLTYRQKDYPHDGSFPPEYDGVHFFADFFAGPLRYLKPEGQGGWSVVEFAQGISRPVDAAIASDGGVYVLEYGSAVRKIVYTGTGVSSESDPSLPSDQLALKQNYPNPFDGRTRFSYRLGQPADIRVSVYNILGEELVALSAGVRRPGEHTVEWDGRDRFGYAVPPGVYIYRVSTRKESISRMMLVAH